MSRNAHTSPRLRRALAWLLRLRGSPEAIARGVAIGMVVAFTPTIGFQTLLALGASTLLNGNRPVSVVPTWITNPITIPPIYGFTYYLGSFFWPGPEPGRVVAAMHEAADELRSLGFLALLDQLGLFLELGLGVFGAMWIGGFIVGGFAAAISYPLTRQAVTALRSRYRQRARRRRRKSGRA